MCRILKLGNGGYTLLESLLFLAVFSAFVQLFLLFFLWKAPIERQYMNKSNTAWELFGLDLQSELVNIQSLSIHAGSRGIQMVNQDNDVIDIDQSNGVIRKRTNKEGHVPLLTDMSSVIFTEVGSQLHVLVTMRDGTRKERDFAIGYGLQ